VGASAGALNGWAIAGGCSPDELIADWLDPANAKLMALRFPFPPWAGVFNPKQLTARVDRLMARFQPRIPYALTTVEVPRLELRLVEGKEIRAEHLLATCAIPCGFPAVRLDGRTLVDGGFLSVLPLWAAAQMGATRAVAIHAMPVMPSRLARWTVGAFRSIARQPAGSENLDVRLIAPTRPATRLREFVRWNRIRIEALIEMGYQDARAATLFDG
jgi:NTE family protein